MRGLSINVLVVTSDLNLIERLNEHEYEGIALRFARNGYEASAVVHSFLPGFAIVDQDAFPSGDNGLLEGLANDPRLPGLKIIIAVRRGETQQLGISENAQHVSRVITKPFGSDQIAGVIESFPVTSIEAEILERLDTV